MSHPFELPLDRDSGHPLPTQIYLAIRDAIREGRLAAGARLPSWRDLAAQVGVSRGTVRAAYERLIDEHLAVAAGAAGTRVVGAAVLPKSSPETITNPIPEIYHDFGTSPLPFQNGVPAEDAFPYGLWSRLLVRGARRAALAPVGYPDPRGDPNLRREISAYLAVARSLPCDPSQVIVTSGFSGALGLVLAALGLAGQSCWLEDPGFPLTRIALERAGLCVTPVPVDGEGIDVATGVSTAPDAKLAVVTPGQHAPLGHVMSRQRRGALLDWAAEVGAWVIEDDYLGELQMTGRAAPALMSLDRHGRVIHAGTFSKTVSPALRLGFLVVPSCLVSRFGDAAAALAPAPMGAGPVALTAFMAEGHYLRHLRRMKRLYAERKRRIVEGLQAVVGPFGIEDTGGFAVRLTLPAWADDCRIARVAAAFGLAVVPLSPWYRFEHRKGLLLGFTNLFEDRLRTDCARLAQIIEEELSARHQPRGEPAS